MGLRTILRLCGLALGLGTASLSAWSPGTGNPTAIQGFTVDTTNRSDVLSFYNTVYTASQNYPADMAWTGDVATDVPGGTSTTFQNDVVRRINFYRALVGLPASITLDATESGKDQEAALMMSVNDQLNHFPPNTWLDYTTDGATAAGNSNLALGSYGPGAIDGYLMDTGSNNTFVGHRRWILYSVAQVMGTGDIPPTGDGLYDPAQGTYEAANALWIMDNFGTAPTPHFTSWPASGYIPFPLMPARWSVSYTNTNADFSNATVTMTQGAINIPVTIISNANNGYGDNTIVWEPTGLPSSISADTPFTVTVSGISGAGVPTSYTYTTTLFDPDVLGSSVTISGSATPPITGATYTFNSIPEAQAYNLQVSTGSTAAWDEGAEDSPPPQIISDTTGSYPLRQTAVVHTGAKAFQLAFPDDLDGDGNPESYAFDDQSFQITRQIIPTATSNLQFWDLGRFATTTTTLSAQVSTDNGTTWTTVWSRPGVGTSSADWDPAFILVDNINHNVSLAAYAGQIILIRFDLSCKGQPAILDDGSDAGFFIDDITVTNATQLVNSTTTALAGSATSFTLNAATAGSALQSGTAYYMLIQPEVGTKWYGFGAYDLVTAMNSTITDYASWITNLYPVVTGGPAGDYSEDGIPNGYKYAFGLNPTVKNPLSSIPAPTYTANSVTLSYTAPAGVAGVTYGAQSSPDLINWTTLTDTGTGNTHLFTVSTVGHSRMFIRNYLIFAP